MDMTPITIHISQNKLKLLNREIKKQGLKDIAAYIELLIARETKTRPKAVRKKETKPVATLSVRRPGLHAGVMRMSADFDQPLPDTFWLGEA